MQAEIEIRPPYVTFEKRAREDRQASIDAGHYVAKDVDFVIITPQGSKDRIERQADEWLESQFQAAKEERIPGSWPRAWKDMFAAWKNDQELPESGHALKNWTALSPAQLDNLLRLRFRTVEDVATATEEGIARIGMGARAIKQLAIDWLGSFENSRGAQELLAMRTRLEASEARQEALMGQIEKLLALVPENLRPKAVSEAKPEAPDLQKL